MNRGSREKPAARRGAARAERERETLRASRYAQRLEREGRSPAGSSTGAAPGAPLAPSYEAEVVPGLETFARAELRAVAGVRLGNARSGAPRDGSLRFSYRGDSRALLSLGTISALYRVHHFEVPRPRALLGEEHLGKLLSLVDGVRALHPPEAFQSFRFGAAGVTSSVFARLGEALQQRTGLRPEPDEGDLLIRVRPAASPVEPAESPAGLTSSSG